MSFQKKTFLEKFFQVFFVNWFFEKIFCIDKETVNFNVEKFWLDLTWIEKKQNSIYGFQSFLRKNLMSISHFNLLEECLGRPKTSNHSRLISEMSRLIIRMLRDEKIAAPCRRIYIYQGITEERLWQLDICKGKRIELKRINVRWFLNADDARKYRLASIKLSIPFVKESGKYLKFTLLGFFRRESIDLKDEQDES